MGQDKAMLSADGEVLWARQREVLRDAGATEIFLSARPDQIWAAKTTGFAAILHDAFPDCGPIMGITAALERMSHGHLAVLAIDLPAMNAEWFRRLWEQVAAGVAARREPDGHGGPPPYSIGVVARRAGFYEPLAAIYPRDMKWLAWEQIARGNYALQALLETAVGQGLMKTFELTGEDFSLFQNWNAPGDTCAATPSP